MLVIVIVIVMVIAIVLVIIIVKVIVIDWIVMIRIVKVTPSRGKIGPVTFVKFGGISSARPSARLSKGRPTSAVVPRANRVCF